MSAEATGDAGVPRGGAGSGTMELIRSVVAKSIRKTASSEATNDAMVSWGETGSWTWTPADPSLSGRGRGGRPGPATPERVVDTGRGRQAGGGEGEKEAGPKDEEEEGEVGCEEGRGTRW